MIADKSPRVESSIIIPVFNRWELTRNCLESIASTTGGEKIEVIAIDNASSDGTQEVCPFFGRQLFGDRFHYARNEINRNFAGASNQGARIAQGDYLIFLNNDTEVQPGWYRPLIDDFAAIPDLAATGPLLTYPEETPLGKMVQHLGVYISPSLSLGHLYEGIPAESALVRRRRFFQVITAACMVIPRSLFLESGGFDERFINGFEDVDLCVRLHARGLKLTVNPGAAVTHHESQTPGRHDYEEHNSKLLATKALHLLSPDWQLHVRGDGMIAGVGDWSACRPKLPEQIQDHLASLSRSADPGQLRELLLSHPYWENGWKRLGNISTPQERSAIARFRIKLFSDPDTAFAVWRTGKEIGDKSLAELGALTMLSFTASPAEYFRQVSAVVNLHAELGFVDMVAEYRAWLDNYDRFKNELWPACARNFLEMARNERLVLQPENEKLYNIWFHEKYRGESEDSGPAFSILMPVWNPKPEHLKAALDSVLAQTYANWELCIADDASTAPDAGNILRKYAAKDPRIRFVTREVNGGISEATNTCLDMANCAWSALLDQDDLLARDALSVMARAISENPEARLLFSDEDETFDGEEFFSPYLKSGRRDPDLLVCQNYICHLTVCSTGRLREIRFRKEYDGARDHDMLLRFTEGLEDRNIVHVPHVLYHWRAHEGRAASDAGSRDYDAVAAREAASEHLGKAIPGAYVDAAPGLVGSRPRFPLPKEKPSVAIVTRPASGQREFLAGSTDYPLVIVDSVAKIPADVNVVGFMDADVCGLSRGWLDEIISALLRPGVGAAGGAVLSPDKRLFHVGYMFDASGKLKRLFGGAPRDGSVWFGWNRLARTVDALDSLCLFTRKETLELLGGVNPESQWWAQDFCLRAWQEGLRTVWWPFAKIVVSDSAVIRRDGGFDSKWDNFRQPFNKNLVITDGGLSLL